MKRFRGFETKFGVDLGTSNTIIYQEGRGIVLSEPSVIAVNRETGEIEAAGEEAWAMVGRTPGHLEVIFPLKNGVIAHFDMTTAMLHRFMHKIKGRLSWFRTMSMHISVPSGVTNVQKRAVEEMVIGKGAKKAVAVEEPLAAALGAGLPVEEPTGSMVLVIGGGTIQVAILSLGGIVVSHSLRRGGLSIDMDIVEYVKKTYNLAIGQRTAEAIKIGIGSAVMPKEETSFDVRGRDLVTGLPKTVTVTGAEIHMLLEDFVRSAVEAIRTALEQCPPELAGDVMERGITMCGGGALLQGLDRRLQEEVLVPVLTAEQPQACVAMGTGRMIGSGSDMNPGQWQFSKQDAAEGEQADAAEL